MKRFSFLSLVVSAFFMLIFALPGCKKGEDSLVDAPSRGEAPVSAAQGPTEAVPVFEAPEIVSLSEAEAAALGPVNDLPTQWIYPGAFKGRIFCPARFRQYADWEAANSFLSRSPRLIPNWGMLNELDLVMESSCYSYAPVSDATTGQPLPQRWPLPVSAIYLKKNAPFDKKALDAFALGSVPNAKVNEQTIGGCNIQYILQSIRVPLDNTGQKTGKVNGVMIALYQPTPDSAVIVYGLKEDIEKFFTSGDGDKRGAFAQRLARADLANADFFWLYDYQNTLKMAIRLPVTEELDKALQDSARAVSVAIETLAQPDTPAVQVKVLAGDEAAAENIENLFGAALMQAANGPENLPAELGVDVSELIGQVGDLIKKGVQVKRNGSEVNVNLLRSETFDHLTSRALVYLNKTIDQANEAARYNQTAYQLMAIGQMINNSYYPKFNHFPPMAICAEDGTPLLSWRVALLSALGPEGEALYNQFHLNEPWNSPHNLTLLDKMPDFYRSMLDESLVNKTTFRIFSSPETPFGRKPEGLTLPDIPQPKNTFMVVSTVPEQAVEWTRPDVLAYEPEKFGEIFGSIVLAIPVSGEIFGAPFTGADNEVKSISNWIMGVADESDETDTPTPPSPAQSPLEMPVE